MPHGFLRSCKVNEKRKQHQISCNEKKLHIARTHYPWHNLRALTIICAAFPGASGLPMAFFISA